MLIKLDYICSINHQGVITSTNLIPSTRHVTNLKCHSISQLKMSLLFLKSSLHSATTHKVSSGGGHKNMNSLSQVDVQRINEVPTLDIDWGSMFVKDCKL